MNRLKNKKRLFRLLFIPVILHCSSISNKSISSKDFPCRLLSSIFASSSSCSSSTLDRAISLTLIKMHRQVYIPFYLFVYKSIIIVECATNISCKVIGVPVVLLLKDY